MPISEYDCAMARAAATSDVFNAIAEQQRREILVLVVPTADRHAASTPTQRELPRLCQGYRDGVRQAHRQVPEDLLQVAGLPFEPAGPDERSDSEHGDDALVVVDLAIGHGAAAEVGEHCRQLRIRSQPAGEVVRRGFLAG